MKFEDMKTSALPDGWKIVRLEEVAEVNPGRPRLSIEGFTPVTFLPMAAVSEGCRGITVRQERPYHEVAKGYTYFRENDVLFAKITPCLQNGKHALATDLKGGFGFGTTEFHVLRAGPLIEPHYLYRVVTQRKNLDKCARSFAGTAGQQRVLPEILKALQLRLPPITEQQTISSVLEGINDALEAGNKVRTALEALSVATAEALLSGTVRVGGVHGY